MRYPIVIFAASCSLLPVAAQTVVNSADYSLADSSGIPRGAIFTIFGTALADSTATANSLPLETTLNGVSVKIAGANLSAEAFLLYVSPTQINAILPSSIPEGSYLFTLVSGSQVTPLQNIPVTSGKFAAFTQGARGFGPALLQQYDAAGRPALNQFTAPAAPGAIMTLWGTGLGPLPDGSDGDAPVAANLRYDVTIYVDGVPAKPLYAGRAPGYPGVDQINFTLPAVIRPRCFVPLAISTGGRFTTGATVAISSSPGACTNEFGLASSALASLDSGRPLRIAMLSFRAGNAQQSVESWIGDYDPASLSFLVNGEGAGLPDGMAFCGFDQTFDGTYGESHYTSFDPNIRNQPKLYGQRRDPGPPLPVVSGPQGCRWSFVSGGEGILGGVGPQCTALSYQFGPGLSVTGDFPPPRPSGDISALTVQGPAESLAASWKVSAAPGDSIVLIVSSYGFGGLGPPIETQVACQLFPPVSSLVFPQPDTARALGQRFSDPLILTLTNLVYRLIPSSDPSLDLIIVRTSNSAVASRPL
jgi:uncharacterized protein (TIGR03437 family)